MHAFGGGILEMHRTEYRRGGDDDHVHAGINDLLIRIEAYEAVIVGDFLSLLLKFAF